MGRRSFCVVLYCTCCFPLQKLVQRIAFVRLVVGNTEFMKMFLTRSPTAVVNINAYSTVSSVTDTILRGPLYRS
jgi:hypothetical protein